MLSDLTIKKFLEEAAAGTPTPGGGSLAALAGAMAAGLAAMVATLTLGRKGHESCQDQMKALAEEARQLRDRLTAAIDRDAEAYGRVMAAYRLPKDSGAARQARAAEIQKALTTAARVPLEVARDALAALELAAAAAAHGNKNAVTDAAVGAMLARTAGLAALWNVRVNLQSITDPAAASEMQAEVSRLEKDIQEREEQILSSISA